MATELDEGPWLLVDDGVDGHHTGYLNGIIDAAVAQGIRVTAISAIRPRAFGHQAVEWIEVDTVALRSVILGIRQGRRASSIGRQLDAVTVDLYLDHGIWRFPLPQLGERRIHVAHHVTQYRSEARTGWASVRTRLARRRLAHLAARGATTVVHTEQARSTLADAVPSVHVDVVPYPIRLESGSHDRPERPEILFVGAARAEKGLVVLLEALNDWRGPEITLRVVGRQEEATLASIAAVRSSTVEVLVEDRFLPDEELAATYRNATVIALPYSRSFGQSGGASGVLLEAIGSGTPLVVSPALASQLPPDYPGAVVATGHTPLDFKSALMQAVQERDHLAHDAENAGPGYVSKYHSFDAYVSGLRKVISALD